MISEDYELRGLIARGGMSEVFRGWDRRHSREVAIKIAHGEVDAKVLFNEARQLSRVRHPGVPVVHASGGDEHEAWMAMELVEGESLETSVGTGVLSLAEFETLAVQTLEILMAAHAAGVLHLDLKPENILVERRSSESLRVKVLDFGSAQTDVPTSDAGSGPVLGSLFYMAPERFDRAAADVRSDLYTLGCVFYFALTGQCPFRGDTAPQVMVAHLRHHLVPLIKARTELPPFTAAWVEWLLERDPAKRPPSAGVALEAWRARRMPESYAL